MLFITMFYFTMSNILEFGQYSRKRAEFDKETNQLRLHFYKTLNVNNLFVLDASAIQYMIKIWLNVPFHEIIDSLTDRHYSLRMIKRQRNGLPLCGPDDMPTYTLQVLYAPDSYSLFESDCIFSENPLFYYWEWVNFRAWMSTLIIPADEERFEYLEHYESWIGPQTNSTHFGKH